MIRPIIDPSTLTESQKELIIKNYLLSKAFIDLNKKFAAGEINMLGIIFGEDFFKSLEN